MPLNSIPATTTVAALEAKRAAARGKCHVDVAFWGGVVPGNEEELDGLVDAGVRGFKCFSGAVWCRRVSCRRRARTLRRAMPVLARRDVPLLGARGTAEVDSPQANASRSSNAEWNASLSDDYAAYLATRPPRRRSKPFGLMVRLASRIRRRVRISSTWPPAEAVHEIERAKRRRRPDYRRNVSALPDLRRGGDPRRRHRNSSARRPFASAVPSRRRCGTDLRRGVLDMIATDHSPAPPALKCRGDFMRAWGGIASLEVSLAAVWTNVVQG